MSKSIGDRMRQIRLEKGMTMQDLGDAIGKSKGNISGYEKGTYEPSAQTIVNMSRIFEVTTDWLLIGPELQSNKTESSTVGSDIGTGELSLEEQLLIQKFRAGVRPLLDEDVRRMTGDAGRLSDAELDLVLKFRALDDRDQEDLTDSANSKYRRSFSAKKSSASSNGNGRMDYDSGVKMA